MFHFLYLFKVLGTQHKFSLPVEKKSNHLLSLRNQQFEFDTEHRTAKEQHNGLQIHLQPHCLPIIHFCSKLVL